MGSLACLERKPYGCAHTPVFAAVPGCCCLFWLPLVAMLLLFVVVPLLLDHTQMQILLQSLSCPFSNIDHSSNQPLVHTVTPLTRRLPSARLGTDPFLSHAANCLTRGTPYRWPLHCDLPRTSSSGVPRLPRLTRFARSASSTHSTHSTQRAFVHPSSLFGAEPVRCHPALLASFHAFDSTDSLTQLAQPWPLLSGGSTGDMG